MTNEQIEYVENLRIKARTAYDEEKNNPKIWSFSLSTEEQIAKMAILKDVSVDELINKLYSEFIQEMKMKSNNNQS